jgi:hypothetical protein
LFPELPVLGCVVERSVPPAVIRAGTQLRGSEAIPIVVVHGSVAGRVAG